MIDTPEALNNLVDKALNCEAVALDTEFVWERTYYPDLGVIQLALSSDDGFLIDAPALSDLTPLGRVLSDPGTVKIVHDAPQDLTILRQVTGASPKNIFDTRMAAGFTGLKATLSLVNLLQEVLQEEVPKTESRTNWLKRPLSEAQLAYAMDDVQYLHALRSALLDRAEACGNLQWLQVALAQYDDASLYEERDPHEQFTRVKGSGGLPATARPVLRELAAWREVTARKCNKPRGHVLPDEMLIQLAKQKPRTPADLVNHHRRFRSVLTRRGPEIIQAVQRGRAETNAEARKARPRPTDYKLRNTRVDLLLARVQKTAAARSIDPVLLATRGMVQELVYYHEAPPASHPLVDGWPAEVLGCAFRDFLTEQLAPQ